MVILLTGFSSGLPLALTGATLQAWMSDAQVNLTVIGVFALATTPYSLKFLWAPLMDHYIPPFLGRRRGWMLICQVALAITIALFAFCDPGHSLGTIAFLAFAVAFFSASQDVAIDAFRTETLLPEELGAGAGIQTLGYRIAMIVSGAGALAMADHLPWKVVYLVMAGAMSIGILATLFASEPKEVRLPKSLAEAFVLPLKEFWMRKGAGEVLLFLFLYKIDAVMANALTTPFLLELGFSKTDIAAVVKTFGIAATIVGVLIGGAWMASLGLRRALWVFGIAQGVSNLTFLLLAHMGKSYPVMMASVAIENICSGMGTAAYTAFMMSLCDRRFTATQFALLTSLMALSRAATSAPTGFLAQHLGWEIFFLISTLIAIPGLAMLSRFKHWQLQIKPGN